MGCFLENSKILGNFAIYLGDKSRLDESSAKILTIA